MRRGWAGTAVLLVLFRAAVAGDPPLAPWQQADLVLKAVEGKAVEGKAAEGKDAAALAALAAADDPDPWLVADELWARGEREAALAFARAAPRKDVERLPPYLESLAARPPERAARAALAEADRAMYDGKPAEALAALEKAPSSMGTVASIRVLYGRAFALKRLDRADESAAAFGTAAQAAEGLSWWARGADGYARVGAHAFRRSRFPAARTALESRLRVEEARGAKAGIAAALGAFGYVCYRLGEHARAVDLQTRALALYEDLKDPLGIGTTLSSLGTVFLRLGETEKASGFLERAIATLETAGDKGALAGALAELAQARFTAGRWPEVPALADRSLRLREEVGDKAGLAAAHAFRGTAHDLMGRMPESLKEFETALALYVEVEDRGGQADTLVQIGRVEEQLGEFASSLRSQERALAILEETGDRTAQAAALASMGTVCARLAAFPRALECLDRAREIQEDLGERPALGTTLGEIAKVYERLGDYSEAVRRYEKVLALALELKDPGLAGTWLLALARVHRRLGDTDAARACEKEGVVFLEKNAGTLGIHLAEIARLRQEDGDLEDALATSQRALELVEKIGSDQLTAEMLPVVAASVLGLGRPREALPLLQRAHDLAIRLHLRGFAAEVAADMARVHLALSDPAKALAMAQAALAEADDLGSPDVAVSALGGIAGAQRRLGRHREAVDAARRGIQALAALAGGQDEESGSTARASQGDLFEDGFKSAVALGDVKEAFFFLESGRALTLLESLYSRVAIQAAAIPQELLDVERDARQSEATARARYRTALDGNDRRAATAARAVLDGARAHHAEVVERIQREAKAAAHVLYPKPTDLDAARRSLAPADVMVLYSVFPDETLALVVTAAEARLVKLGPTAPILRAVEALRPGDPARDSAAAVDALRKLVVDPLELPAEARRFLVSPDHVLSQVPFVLLAGDREVAHVPSATTYLALREAGAPSGEGVLALGDPDYSARPAPGPSPSRGPELVPLPGTQEEARAVGDLVLLKEKATESGLRAALATRARWRAVHLACHGILDPERPTLSSLALTPSGEDDGLLTALDVFRMRIPADLAVLSACETGRGKVFRGEGLLGLPRAFLFAGAPRVIVSLWNVNDEATRALMTKFYERWKAGVPTARALKEAQDHVRSQEKWKHPYFWAAWVLWGLPE